MSQARLTPKGVFFMKSFVKSFFCLSLLLVAGAVKADSCASSNCSSNSAACTSIFLPMSVGSDLSRQHHHKHYRPEADCLWADFGATYEYNRSMKESRISESLFGVTDNKLGFQGKFVKDVAATKNDSALLADYFGLSPETNDNLVLSPRIQNHVIDFELHVGLDELLQGLYLHVNLPVVHTKWQLIDTDCKESADTATKAQPTTTFNKGYMDAYAQAAPVAAKNFQEALGGDFKFGDMQTSWKYGRFNLGNGSCADKTGVAGLHVNLGYNIFDCPDYRVAVYAKYVAPVGTDINADHAKNVFTPAIGLDHHQVYGGVTAAMELWNKNDEHMLEGRFQGHIGHAFKKCQVRSFDFANNGCMSRYMLLKEFGDANAYAGNLYNAINYTTRNADVSIDLLGEAMVDLNYRYQNWGINAGYRLAGKSKEDICIKGAVDNSLNSKKLGIKGCSPVEALDVDGTGTNNTVVAGVVGLAGTKITESNATAYGCGAVDNGQAFVVAANHFVANPAAKAVNAANLTNGQANVGVNGFGVQNSVEPKTFTNANADNLDANSAAVKSQLSHSVFGDVNYTWEDCDFTPMVHVGGQVTFASSSDTGTLNSWSLRAGGSISF